MPKNQIINNRLTKHEAVGRQGVDGERMGGRVGLFFSEGKATNTMRTKLTVMSRPNTAP